MPALHSSTSEADEPRGHSLSGTGEDARLRGDFLMLASHELMTPLTSLKLQMQAMRRRSERDHAEVPAWAASMLAVCDRQIGRLSRLCEDLIQAIRVQADDLSPASEETDCGSLVREVARSVASQSQVAADTIAVSADEGLVGRWDRSLIERLLFHLIKNAVTFGDHKPVTVEARATDGGVRFTVRDQGIGIAKEDQERIFGCFERVVPVEHFGGLGLGLYLARAVVHAYEGSIRVESEPGSGATFIVELPTVKESN
jgi:two-component system sensor histidine kinase SenX3